MQLGPEAWQEVEPSAEDVGPSEAAARHEALGELAVALDTLTPMQRRVLLLRYYGQLSFAEIAATVECPLNTVLSHCHRGLEALRKLMVEKEVMNADEKNLNGHDTPVGTGHEQRARSRRIV